METVGANNCIKRTLCKRQIFAVAYEKFRIGKIFCLSHTDHFGGEIKPYIMFIRVFFMKQLNHRSCSASAVQHIVKLFFFQFSQNRRVIILAHFINTSMSAVIDFCGLRKFFDREFFIFFRCHSSHLLHVYLFR